MRATYLFGAGDVRVIDAPDQTIQQPTDALVRIVRACVCGSDLHPFHSLPASEAGTPMGHEFIGIVEALGAEVTSLRRGDFVIGPFAWSCGACEFCRAGLQTSCVRGGFWAARGIGGAQAELLRVPLADGTLVPVPGVGPDSGDQVLGGLLAVLSAKQLGAERIILMGRHTSRTDLGREFGATDVVAARGREGIEAVRELTDGGSPIVLEAVGLLPAYEQAVGTVRPGGVISRVGVPQYEEAPVGFTSLFGPNVTLTGGPAPARAYIEPLLSAVLDGTVQPGRVFDRTVSLEETPQAYAAMDDRTALKVMVRP